MSEHSVEKLMWVAERVDAYLEVILGTMPGARMFCDGIEQVKQECKVQCKLSLNKIYDSELREFYEKTLDSPETAEQMGEFLKLALKIEGGGL